MVWYLLSCADEALLLQRKEPVGRLELQQQS